MRLKAFDFPINIVTDIIAREADKMARGIDWIWEMARGFQPSRIVLTAAELGIFGQLRDGSKTSAEVASAIGTDPRATDRLMNALDALGLLVKQGDMFVNTDDAQEYLVPGKPEYAGGALMHANNMWDSWSTLTQAVKAGTSVFRREEEEYKEWVKPFIAAMHYIAMERAPKIVSLLDLENVHRVLDVGGGSGAYSIAFCNAKPDIEAVVFDLPDVVPLTQQYVAEACLSERISTTTGDYNKDDLGSEFDIVFLSAIIHSNSPEENIELFRKSRRALKPNGQIVVQDFIMDPDRTSPPMAAVFALNMLVGTEAGDTYTEEEVRDWFEKASFTDAQRIDPPEGGTVLLTARAKK